MALKGSATFPRDFDILKLSIVQCPWVRRVFGGSRPSAKSIAGQYIAWNLQKYSISRRTKKAQRNKQPT